MQDTAAQPRYYSMHGDPHYFLQSHLPTNKVDNPHPDKEVEQEIKSLLLILVNLVERHRYLSGIVLDKIYIVVEQLVSLLNELTGMTNSGSDDHHITELDKENRTSTASRVLLYLSQILITCFEMLDVSTAGSTQLFNRMEHLVDHMHRSVYVAGDDMVSNRNFRLSRCSSLSRVSRDGSLSQHEIFIIDRAKQILDKRDYWLSYKLAKYAACHGAWLVAAYVFGKLITMVRSDNCCFWLKSLSHLSELERQVQLLGLTLSGNTGGKIATINHIENVVGASNKLCSLEKAFDASVSGLAFSFQRWFITLRSKVVETVADIQIPFRTPKHFFRLRPPISAELFITNEDGTRIDEISVLSGFQLPLTLCIQLRNISPAQLSQVSKLLLHFTTGSTKSGGLHAMGSAGGTSALDKFVFFDPNDKGQGFATCLLDVSAFPVESNRKEVRKDINFSSNHCVFSRCAEDTQLSHHQGFLAWVELFSCHCNEVFDDPWWKLKMIMQYFQKYIPKSSVRTM
ncbi:hypothetical protein K7X08_033738 [Anisodus acutangulus]|uniref:Uncharacterized protein n=1 Tax=Anisodus acutangulus TaxID=402998 RepID=A0A9Q1M653_9SOLA|nr:hypothetical protein K7X08_033738 [Anisodus acutangulus]